jgi:hypothetical protein
MDIQDPSPQTTLVILLGASEWADPNLQGSQAFTNAKRSFLDYVLHQLKVPEKNVLDLFDTPDAPHMIIDEQIGKFLEQRTSEMKEEGNVARDLLVYFVGHGGFDEDSNYYLAIRCTSENVDLSAIPIKALAKTFRDKVVSLRRIIILDSCYSAAAFAKFQGGIGGPAKIGNKQASEAFEKRAKTIGRGTALLCSSGKRAASQIAKDHSCTMFTKALLGALYTGIRNDKQYLSLNEVHDLVEEIVKDRFRGKAPRPEVHSPDQANGDVADVPFFPNPCYDPNYVPPRPAPAPPRVGIFSGPTVKGAWGRVLSVCLYVCFLALKLLVLNWVSNFLHLGWITLYPGVANPPLVNTLLVAVIVAFALAVGVHVLLYLAFFVFMLPTGRLFWRLTRKDSGKDAVKGGFLKWILTLLLFVIGLGVNIAAPFGGAFAALVLIVHIAPMYLSITSNFWFVLLLILLLYWGTSVEEVS